MNIAENVKKSLQQILENRPEEWLRLTTHRLDIYREERAKEEFICALEELILENRDGSSEALASLPTAYDYIRLGHPLSCLLEWVVSKNEASPKGAQNVVAFASRSMPLLAVLRKNLFLKKKTRLITVKGDSFFNKEFAETLKSIYGYDLEVFETSRLSDLSNISDFSGSTVVCGDGFSKELDHNPFDFNLRLFPNAGSLIEVLIKDKVDADAYIKEIQHVRRRETIAMTPQSCLSLLKDIITIDTNERELTNKEEKNKEKNNEKELEKIIQTISQSATSVCLGTSGLSVQYAIMMGLIDYASTHQTKRPIHFIVPPNCYGGTNDQARRVAACKENVEIVDLPVDSGKDMVSELQKILSEIEKAPLENRPIPYIIAEIPTNPRVEIPDLVELRETLKSPTDPVFILDQTFCPNVLFFGEEGHLHDVPTLSYVSGSKFPSGGLCTAGYCVGNSTASKYFPFIQKHLDLCDNGATSFQKEILKKEMPGMNERIAKAYENTRGFVDFISETLPSAKINFVSHELAKASFTPSVFSLDLAVEEKLKHELNHKLISMMISEIPEESKHCVSYGQLKGCYWTIPATSTQGTTQEKDKDYIVRVSVAAEFNLEKHKEVFKKFCLTVSLGSSSP